MSASSESKQQFDLALLKRLWPFTSGHRKQLIAALLMTPLTLSLALIQPWLLKTGIDSHIVPKKLDGLQWIAGAYLGAVILAYITEATYSLLLAYSGQHTILRVRERLYTHFLALAPSFYDQRPAGALLTRATSDVEALGETLSSNVVTIILDFLMVTGILVMMFVLNWRLTLVLLCVAPPLMWILAYFRKKLRGYFLQIRETLAQVNAHLAESITGVEVTQLFNHQGVRQKEFVRRNTIYKDATIRSNIYDALMYAVVDGVGSIAMALILWYAISPWVTSALTIGLLVAFIDYLQRLFRPLQEFSGKIAIIQRATTALIKIFALLDDKEIIQPGALSISDPKGHIQFKDVSFGYNKDEDILRDITLEVHPGEVLAIVGPSGCGKTTLTRLLTRSYEGYRGSILLDGEELSNLDIETVRSNIATVQQDIQLFSETVQFNVDLDNPDISLTQLDDAAVLVHASPFIKQLPEQWSHILRERGGNLSVGQGQLLTFARTMAYNPVVVILDEATASIDSETESLVQDAINTILQRKTVIVIAHRLSTITAADRIVVLRDGNIVEQGNHEQLLSKDGLYAELVHKGFAS